MKFRKIYLKKAMNLKFTSEIENKKYYSKIINEKFQIEKKFK